MKRIMMLLTVVALMMVMLVSGVASAAFAATLDSWGCRVSDRFITFDQGIVPGFPPDHNGDGKFCQYIKNGKVSNRDNHLIQ
jgi:hypothetical protein